MAKVTFIPDDVTVEVEGGSDLLHAALMADVHVSASCGGSGTCGKCRMVLHSGETESLPSSKLSVEQAAEGYVLACRTEILGDLTVMVPPESRPGGKPSPVDGRRGRVLTAEEHAERLPEFGFAPLAALRSAVVSEPDMSDNVSDLTRIVQRLRVEGLPSEATVSLEAVRKLPGALREGGWEVTATTADTGEGPVRVIDVRPGSAGSVRLLAAAVDVGTTAIDVALIDEIDGSTIAQGGEYNAQTRRGEDVISRIIAASTPSGLHELQSLASSTIDRIVRRLLSDAGADEDDLQLYCVAGNTVMTHLLMGVSPRHIREDPYVPAASSFPVAEAGSLSLPGLPSAPVVALPCPAGWLGGDVVAGLVAAGVPWSEKLTLFVDIGTNGEIVLGNSEWLVACSCSAGPAFEGGGITQGMRAANGAIEGVRIDPSALEPMVVTVGGRRALGICGSGLIDCVSELLLAGAIERDGTFSHDTSSRRVREGERGMEYVLVFAEDSGTGGDISLTEGDIGNLMRAKAALHAGIQVLMESVGVGKASVEEVVVAGGFGHHLDIERVTLLGMLPEMPPGSFTFVGNASLTGARLAATSAPILQAARDVAERITYLELSADGRFMDAYVSAMFLPHTDLGLFPLAEETLRKSRSAKAAS